MKKKKELEKVCIDNKHPKEEFSPNCSLNCMYLSYNSRKLSWNKRRLNLYIEKIHCTPGKLDPTQSIQKYILLNTGTLKVNVFQKSNKYINLLQKEVDKQN